MCIFRLTGVFLISLLLEGCMDTIDGNSRSATRRIGYYVADKNKCDAEEDVILLREDCAKAFDNLKDILNGAIGNPNHTFGANQTNLSKASEAHTPHGCWAQTNQCQDNFCKVGVTEEKYDTFPNDYFTLCYKPCKTSSRTKLCAAWGDPHYTSLFYGKKKIDHHGFGLARLAMSNDDNFEVHSFQCPFHNHGAAIYGAFAVKDRNMKFTVVGEDVKVWTLDNKQEGDISGKFPVRNGKKTKWESKDQCFGFTANYRRYDHAFVPTKHYYNMIIETASDFSSDVGFCGDESYNHEEQRFLKGIKGAERKHLHYEDSLFPPLVLKDLCNTCAEYAFKHVKSSWNLALGMFCDACPAYDDHEICKKWRQKDRRRLSNATNNADLTDEANTTSAQNMTDEANTTSAEKNASAACGNDPEKLAAAEEACRDLNNTDHFDGCCYDVCVASAAGASAEEAQDFVEGANESKQEVDMIAENRAAQDSSSFKPGSEWSLYLFGLFVLAW